MGSSLQPPTTTGTGQRLAAKLALCLVVGSLVVGTLATGCLLAPTPVLALAPAPRLQPPLGQLPDPARHLVPPAVAATWVVARSLGLRMPPWVLVEPLTAREVVLLQGPVRVTLREVAAADRRTRTEVLGALDDSTRPLRRSARKVGRLMRKTQGLGRTLMVLGGRAWDDRAGHHSVLVGSGGLVPETVRCEECVASASQFEEGEDAILRGIDIKALTTVRVGGDAFLKVTSVRPFSFLFRTRF